MDVVYDKVLLIDVGVTAVTVLLFRTPDMVTKVVNLAEESIPYPEYAETVLPLFHLESPIVVLLIS